jgi:hypothetical protein
MYCFIILQIDNAKFSLNGKESRAKVSLILDQKRIFSSSQKLQMLSEYTSLWLRASLATLKVT